MNTSDLQYLYSTSVSLDRLNKIIAWLANPPSAPDPNMPDPWGELAWLDSQVGGALMASTAPVALIAATAVATDLAVKLSSAKLPASLPVTKS